MALDPHQRIRELYRRLIEAAATEKELEELHFLAAKPENDPIFQEMFAESWNELEQADDKVQDFVRRRQRAAKPVVRPFAFQRRIRWVAAAAAIILIAGGYLYFNVRTEKPNAVVRSAAVADIKAPQTNRATITLAGGRKIFLDSIASGTLAKLGDVRVLKLADGQIAYNGMATGDAYNTLTNPRGSKVVDITLSDGSRVWLNSGSSLTYPVAFTGGERDVEITGEAYFEVVHNASMPFAVKKTGSDLKIQVLGTNFNVSAYDDDPDLKVTLLQGSVRVIWGRKSNLLSPGQQAGVRDGRIYVLKDADTEEVMAWKNGKFRFGEKADIESVMRQVARWYDVDIQYEGQIAEHIGGSISREVNVSRVLKMLQATGSVKFKIEGRKVIVMPASP